MYFYVHTKNHVQYTKKYSQKTKTPRDRFLWVSSGRPIGGKDRNERANQLARGAELSKMTERTATSVPSRPQSVQGVRREQADPLRKGVWGKTFFR